MHVKTVIYKLAKNLQYPNDKSTLVRSRPWLFIKKEICHEKFFRIFACGFYYRYWCK